MQRPALFPPSDGYLPPEDPLRGVARQDRRHGAVEAGGSRTWARSSWSGGYRYLQEWLPNVGQCSVRHGLTDFVGLGRMVLSYPQMPADVLAGRPLQRKLVCRTFSDLHDRPAPRTAYPGCYPLDPFYLSASGRGDAESAPERATDARAVMMPVRSRRASRRPPSPRRIGDDFVGIAKRTTPRAPRP